MIDIKIPVKFAPFIFAFFMSGLMAGIMSGALTALNIGLSMATLLRWGHVFPTAWSIAFPCVLVLAPLVKRLVSKMVVQPSLG